MEDLAAKITSKTRLVAAGYLFYFGSRRRDRGEFSPELRARTEVTVRTAFDLLERGQMPGHDIPESGVTSANVDGDILYAGE